MTQDNVEMYQSVQNFLDRGQFDQALLLANALLGETSKDTYLLYAAGRAMCAQHDFVGGIACLERALDPANPFVWASYEIAFAKLAQGEIIAAGHALREFLMRASDQIQINDLNDAHRQFMLDATHQVFEKDRALAKFIYNNLNNFGIGDYLSTLRCLEFALDDNNKVLSNYYADQLLEFTYLDVWAKFALFRLAVLDQNKDSILQQANEIIYSYEDSTPHWMVNRILHCIIDARMLESALHLKQTIEIERTYSEDMFAFIDFRLAVFQKNRAYILDELRHENLAGWPDWILVELVFEYCAPRDVVTPDDDEIVNITISEIERRGLTTIAFYHATLHYYAIQRKWDIVDQITNELAKENYSEDLSISARLFDIACLRHDIAAAQKIYVTVLNEAPYDRWLYTSLIRFLCEIGDWSSASKRLSKLLESGHTHKDSLQLYLTIARRANSHNDLIGSLQLGLLAVQNPEADNLKKLQKILLDDLRMRGPHTGSPAVSAASLSNSSLERSEILFPIEASSQSKSDFVFFFCVDKKYFFGFICSLQSVIFCAESSRLPEYDVKVFLASDVPEEWVETIYQVCHRKQIPLEVIRIDTIIEFSVELKPNYGIFTGGSRLSAAAYHRIYAARYLAELAQYKYGFYLDADVICLRPGFDAGLFDDEAYPLLARAEEDNPEVAEAAHKHGIERGSYFNSGVLGFNFTHPELRKLLERTVNVIQNDSANLTFHDQCALNIAFRGSVRLIEKQYNLFVRPHRDNNGAVEEAILIHYLDRPKPWDVSYSRCVGTYWEIFARAVRGAINPTVYLEITRAANEP